MVIWFLPILLIKFKCENCFEKHTKKENFGGKENWNPFLWKFQTQALNSQFKDHISNWDFIQHQIWQKVNKKKKDGERGKGSKTHGSEPHSSIYPKVCKLTLLLPKQELNHLFFFFPIKIVRCITVFRVRYFQDMNSNRVFRVRILLLGEPLGFILSFFCFY